MRLFFSVLILLALGAAAFVFLLWRDEDPSRIIEADVAEAHFAFPAAYARDEAAANGGFTDRLALAALFPDFSPPARADMTPAAGAKGQRGQRLVFVTVSLKDDSVDPAERPSRLYARFLEGDAWSGPGGLILRRFEQDSPYDLEQLYLAPPDGREFFARCPKPRAAGQTAGQAPADMCLSMFRAGALDVELRFQPALLEHWEALMDGAHAFIGRIAQRGRAKK
jgi:hypothetical protein